MSNVMDDFQKAMQNVAEEVCEYACKYREAYGDTDALIDERCVNCPLMQLF